MEMQIVSQLKENLKARFLLYCLQKFRRLNRSVLQQLLPLPPSMRDLKSENRLPRNLQLQSRRYDTCIITVRSGLVTRTLFLRELTPTRSLMWTRCERFRRVASVSTVKAAVVRFLLWKILDLTLKRLAIRSSRS